jgi:putative endonuclease
MLIYKILNLVNNKLYIGQTTLTLEKRIYAYKYDAMTFSKGKYKYKSKIIKAIAKYGLENFKFTVIDTALNQQELDEKEKFWIKKLNSTDRDSGYNIQLGGFGVGKHSEETKQLMSAIKKGKPAHNKGKPGLSGERVGTATLTQEQADKIREEYRAGQITSRQLAYKYNVSKTTILGVINNKHYKTANGKVELPQKKWFVYIIQSQKDWTLYTGITLDVEARLKTHNAGRGARYTMGRTPFVVIKVFQCESKSDALKLEYKIKQLSKEEKLKL